MKGRIRKGGRNMMDRIIAWIKGPRRYRLGQIAPEIYGGRRRGIGNVPVTQRPTESFAKKAGELLKGEV